MARRRLPDLLVVEAQEIAEQGLARSAVGVGVADAAIYVPRHGGRRKRQRHLSGALRLLQAWRRRPTKERHDQNVQRPPVLPTHLANRTMDVIVVGQVVPHLLTSSRPNRRPQHDARLGRGAQHRPRPTREQAAPDERGDTSPPPAQDAGAELPHAGHTVHGVPQGLVGGLPRAQGGVPPDQPIRGTLQGLQVQVAGALVPHRPIHGHARERHRVDAVRAVPVGRPFERLRPWLLHHRTHSGACRCGNEGGQLLRIRTPENLRHGDRRAELLAEKLGQGDRPQGVERAQGLRVPARALHQGRDGRRLRRQTHLGRGPTALRVCGRRRRRGLHGPSEVDVDGTAIALRALPDDRGALAPPPVGGLIPRPGAVPSLLRHPDEALREPPPQPCLVAAAPPTPVVAEPLRDQEEETHGQP
mmetsp:Transcript_49688/g.142991  ORF Transcript_49688/g.142991 Transcript_49688/m.142991 type:complete len:416 (-) Transcript_49688:118-1365(-)